MLRAMTPEARAQKKEIILDSALELFLEKGYNHTTIESIMQKAGLSTGTYYLYYKSKTEVFKDLLSRGIDILDGLFSEAIVDAGPSAFKGIRALTSAYLDFFNTNKEYFEIIALISVQSDDLRERESPISGVIDQKNLAILKQIEAIILDGQKTGEIRQLDAWMATNTLWGMMDGILLLNKRGNLKTVQIHLHDLMENSVKLFYEGIRNEQYQGSGFDA